MNSARATAPSPDQAPDWWHEGLAAFLPGIEASNVTLRVPSAEITNRVAASIQRWWSSEDWYPQARNLPRRSAWTEAVRPPPLPPGRWDSELVRALELERERRQGISNRLEWISLRWNEVPESWASSNVVRSWQRVWPSGLASLIERELELGLTNEVARTNPLEAGEWLRTFSNVVVSTRQRLTSVSPLPEALEDETLGTLTNRVLAAGWRGLEEWRTGQSNAWVEVVRGLTTLTNRSEVVLVDGERYPSLLDRVIAARVQLKSAAEILRIDYHGFDAALGRQCLDALEKLLESLQTGTREAARKVDDVRTSVHRQIATIGSSDPRRFLPVLAEARRQIDGSESVAELADALSLVDRVEIALKQLGDFEEQLAISGIAAAERWPTNHVEFLHASRLLAGQAEGWMREVAALLAADAVGKAAELLPAVDVLGRFPALVNWHRERLREGKARVAEGQPKVAPPPELSPGRKFATYWVSKEGMLPQTDPTVLALRRELERISDGQTRFLISSEYEEIEGRITPPATLTYPLSREDPNFQPFWDYAMEEPCPMDSSLLKEELGYYLRIKVEKILNPTARIRLNATLVRFGAVQSTNFEIAENFERDFAKANEKRPASPSVINNRSRQDRSGPVRHGVARMNDEGTAIRVLAEKLWDQVRRHRERFAGSVPP